MSTLYNQVLLNFLDANNERAVTFWATQDQGAGGSSAYSALAAATQALCDARITHVQFQTTLVLGGAPSSGAYQSVFDRAAFLGKYGSGLRPSQFSLPGPKESIFQAGHELVDMSNPDVIAWIAAMQGVIGNASGTPLQTIVRGIRTRAGGN